MLFYVVFFLSRRRTGVLDREQQPGRGDRVQHASQGERYLLQKAPAIEKRPPVAVTTMIYRCIP